jgi:hypothetical protein
MPIMSRARWFFNPLLSVLLKKKMEIWNRTLHQQFPTYEIMAKDVTSILMNFQSPFHHRSALYTPLIVSVSTTLWYIPLQLLEMYDPTHSLPE